MTRQHGIRVAATLMAGAASALLSASPVAAAPRARCAATPFVYGAGDTATHEVRATQRGIVVVFSATGGSTTLHCDDDSHPLNGQTVVVGQSVATETHRESGDERIFRVLGSLRGVTIDMDVPFDIGVVSKGRVGGTGVCDAGGACSFDLVVTGRTSKGARLTLVERVTVDVRGRVVSGVEVLGADLESAGEALR